MKVAVLLLAAGRGTRFGGDIAKQYVKVCGQEILLHTLQSLAQEPRIAVVLPVIAENDTLFATIVRGHHFPFQLLPAIHGGAERSISMQNGLAALPDDVDIVAVHDAARPLTSKAVLADVLDMAEKHGAAIPGLAVNDTIKRIADDGKILETPNRTYLRAVQTPQVARRVWFEKALKQECKRLHLHTDDASVLEAAGFSVYLSQGDINNRKITTQDDLQWMNTQLTYINSPQKKELMMRMGQGFDVHAFAENRALIIGGIDIPYHLGLAGHSDADVLIHAICDALLGAAGLGDIGHHFPDNDPQYAGIDSKKLLIHVMQSLANKGLSVGNLDATVIAQKPKLAPHIADMRKCLADLLNIQQDLCNIKATTTEKLGFTGRGEGIAAQAVVLLFKV